MPSSTRDARLGLAVARNTLSEATDGSTVTEPLTYEVLRAPSADAEPTPVTPKPIADRMFVDANLENDRAYYYAVRAVRVVAGTTIYGRRSASVVVTPRDVTPPSPPANLVGIASEGAVRGIGVWCEANGVDAWFREAPMLRVATTESQVG